MKKLLYQTLIVLGISVNAFSQAPTYSVYALKYAGGRNPIPLKFLVLNAPDNEIVDPVFMFWLIKGDNGKNILVDAGFLSDVEEAKGFDVVNYIRPDSMLLGLGMKPGDITDIIITHPHWDHMDGISLFPNAQIWIQKDDYDYVVGSAWQKGGRGGFNKRDIRQIVELNMAGKLFLVDGDNKEIIPGITVYTGSRHTFNSQYALVKTGQDKIILASDNAYTYYNLDNLKSAPAEATFDTTAYVKSMSRMKGLVSDKKYVIPGHDGLVFSRFPQAAPGIVKIR